jgi:TonB-dependent Receptor Plug Domain/TonB dependent receptor
MRYRVRPSGAPAPAFIIAVSATVLASSPRIAAAQAGAKTDTTRVTELAPITVTGSREESVAPPVSTIEVAPEVLRKSPATNPYDMVRRAAGIEVHEQGQGPGFASDAVIRGFTSDHSSDVLLVIDGVPINLPLHGHVEGYSDWSILSPSAISALRVIHGPATPLYGDFAFGGVVEAFTAADATGRSGAVEASSYGDIRGWMRSGTHQESGGGLMALDGQRVQGWRDNSDYWQGNFALRGWRKAGAGRLEGGLIAYGSTWDSPGFVSVDRYNSGDLESANDPTDGGSAGRLILSGRYAVPVSESTSLETSAWSQGLFSTVFLGIPEDGALEQTEERDKRVAFGGHAQMTWHTGTGEVTGGVSGRADWIGYDLYNTEARVRTGTEQDDDGRYQSASAFARWRGLLGQRIVYDLGGRFDLLHYNALDQLSPDEGWRGDTHGILSPKLGARYLLSSKVALLASLSRGFRGVVGVIQDPTRPPSIAWAKEVGALYEDERARVELALFRLDVSHERIMDPVTREISDEGQSERQGLSLDVAVAATQWLRLTGEGTWNDATISDVVESPATIRVPAFATIPLNGTLEPRFHDVPLTPGATVPGVSEYFGRVGAEAAVSRTVTSRALVRFSGPYTPIGEPTVRTQAYAVVDVGASFALTRFGGALDVDLLNLLDTRYPELRASGFINPGAPFTLRAAFRLGDR